MGLRPAEEGESLGAPFLACPLRENGDFRRSIHPYWLLNIEYCRASAIFLSPAFSPSVYSSSGL